jgi:4,5-DOPA dioxygenase extradiol
MNESRLPVLFVGHGNPMNAMEDNEFSRAWIQVGSSLPRPQAILCISAHWETLGTEVTATQQPETIHDFYGFPAELFSFQYPAPGLPELADRIRSMLHSIDVRLDQQRGLDHGTWSVLARMFPRADIPVLQLSLDRTRDTKFHFDLGRELAPLRKQGVLIIGSGNVVHNLGLVVWKDIAFDWAQDFDCKIREWILDDQYEPILHYETSGKPAHLAVNTAEHYEPLLYVLGSKEPGEPVRFFTEKIWGGSISMRSLIIG